MSSNDEAPGDDLDVGRVVTVLFDNRWTILAVTLSVMVVASAYSLVATPIFRSDVLLLVEPKGGTLTGLDELSTLLGAESPSEAEIEIIRSRSLLGAVVKELSLDVVAEPKRIPIIGTWLAHKHKSNEPAEAFWGLDSYAWGGEAIKVETFEVRDPEFLEEEFSLIAREGNAFELRDPQGDLLLESSTGNSVQGSGVALHVVELRARPGTVFRLIRRSTEGVIRQLQQELMVIEKGKKTGIIQASLSGPDSRQIATILDAISAHYVRQNIDRRSEEASKTIDFLSAQLPSLKEQIEVSEKALNDYRSQKGSVDLTLEAQAALQQSVEIEKRISELELNRADLRRRFTENHPMLGATERQLHDLRATRKAVDDRLRELPESELQSARLMRDMKVSTELYTLLLNKSQELRVLKSGTVGNVRVIDFAAPGVLPEWPKRGLIVFFGLLGGMSLGIGLAMARRIIAPGVDSAEHLEMATGIGVYASVVHSDAQAEHERQMARSILTGRHSLLALSAPEDLAVEGLRSLRTSLQFAMLEAPNNIVMVTSSGPGRGKSFVCANTAWVLASAGKRVLLIDADLRRGRLNKFFGLQRTTGLTDVLRDGVDASNALHTVNESSLQFLAAGTTPPNPAELLGSERCRRLLEELASKFDVVIMDTPPILAVTDAGVLGRWTGVNLLVTRATRDTSREVVASLRVLSQAGVKVNGLVFNDVPFRPGVIGQYNYAYSYDNRS